MTRGTHYGIIALVVILFTGFLLFYGKHRSPGFYIWTFAVFLGYGVLIFLVCKYPAERFHLLEYGVLVILVYRALVTRIKTARIYFLIILYTFAVGFIDELIQALLPNRVYDNRDIAINWAASLLATGLLLVAATWRRPGMLKNKENHNERED
ncbi:MAG: VanZ family protein [Deltaproteobacteria bacterium]|nr:VanZ family protein [Deltaproteobacteria bacterium]